MKSSSSIFLNSLTVWIISVLFLSLFTNQQISAQTDTEFWFVVPEVTINHQMPGGVPASFRISTGDLPATVTISMPANSVVFPDIVIDLPSYSFHIEDISCWIVTPCNPPFTPGGVYNDLNLVENKPLNASGINNMGFLITSTAPVTVYYEVSRTNNKDIWTLKGKNGLGTEFFTPFQTNRDNQSLTPTQPYSAIDIVATADDTEVTFILPPGKQASYGAPRTDLAAGSTFSTTLNRGQTFSLFPIDFSREATKRLNGVKITSSKNIAVTVNDDSFFHTGGGCYDLAGDQLIPTNLIGKEYIVTRTNLYQPGSPILNEHDHIYILATVNGTQVEIYDDAGLMLTGYPITINAAQQHYVRIPAPEVYYRIVTSEPVYVWHIGGFGCEQGGAIVPPVDVCSGTVKQSFARTSAETFYMIMMVRKGAENSFQFMVQTSGNSGTFVDKSYLLEPAFAEVIDSEWSVQRFGPFTTEDIPVGNHFLINDNDYFHMGVINGSVTSGCFYGYFSNYNEFAPTAFVVETGASGAKIEYGGSLHLYASGGTSYKWVPSTFLDNDEIANPLASNITNSIQYAVTIDGACNSSSERYIQIMVGDPIEADFSSDIYSGCAIKETPTSEPELIVTFTNLSTGDYYREWFYKLGESGVNQLFASGNEGAGTGNIVSCSFPNNTADTLRYYITLSITDEIMVSTKTITRSILVYPYIDINPTISAESGCHPLDVNFIANPLGNSGEATYNWDFGDGGNSANENPSHAYSNFNPTSQVFSTSLTITDKWNYCSATKYMDVTVFPYIHASFTTDQDEGQSPLSVQFTDNSTGANSWLWDMGDGSSHITQNPLHVFNNNTNENVSYDVTLSASNENGCSSQQTKTVTVFPSGAYTVTFDIQDAFSNSLTDAIITLNGNQSEPGQYTFANISPGTYNYTVSHGCAPEYEGQTEITDSDVTVEVTMESLLGDANGDISVNVTDLAIMVGNILGTYNGFFCFYNADVVVDNTINIQDVIAAANIILGGKSFTKNTSSSNSADIYLSNEGIKLSSDGTIAGLQIELNNVPQELTLISDLNDQQLSYKQNGNKIIALVYSIENTPIPAGVIDLLHFQNLQDLPEWGNVLAANSDAEMVTTQKHVGEVTSIQTLENQISLNIYPNPANELLFVSLNNYKGCSITVNISNIHGQNLHTQESKNLGSTEFKFDISKLSSGIFILSIDYDGDSVNKLFVKQ